LQTRLLASLAGGCFGFLVASPINGVLGLAPVEALIGCSLLGTTVGYAVSIFIDVFTSSAVDPDRDS